MRNLSEELNAKKEWVNPEVSNLNIEDTFGGPGPLDVNDGPHYDPNTGNNWWGGRS